MVWNRIITFETTSEPWDAKKPRYSQYHDPINSIAFRENRYFYPSGTQLSGNEVPPDGTYIPVAWPPGGKDNSNLTGWGEAARDDVSIEGEYTNDPAPEEGVE